MLRRLGIYLNEMFPISSIIGSIVAAFSVQLVYLRLYQVYPLSYFQLFIPAIVLTLVSLLIRIMDEFKDYQDDLTNFPNRPLPSGRVEKKDLKALAFFCVMMILFLSMTSMPLLKWSLVTLVYTFLMLKWFFIEDVMRKSLPLAFASHHPIVLFNFIYLIIACTQISPFVNFEKAFYVLPLCLIFTNWEIMRKIRAPEQETGYTTYSKIFGPKAAMGVALLLQLVFITTVILIFVEIDTSIIFQALFLLIQLALMIPCFRFLITLKAPSPFKSIAENQILVVVFAILIAALI